MFHTSANNQFLLISDTVEASASMVTYHEFAWFQPEIAFACVVRQHIVTSHRRMRMASLESLVTRNLENLLLHMTASLSSRGTWRKAQRSAYSCLLFYMARVFTRLMILLTKCRLMALNPG